MAIVKKIVIWLVVITAAFLLMQTIASERGEVVVLITSDQDGERDETRLWVVDHNGFPYLRAGSANAQWLANFDHSDHVVNVQRDGVIRRYRAVPDPAALATINALVREKYGWSDQWISLYIDRANSMAIRLEPYKPG